MQQVLRKMDPKVVKEILKAITDVKFGSVQIIVQDSKVIQIDKVEKVRLDKLSK